MNVIPISTLRHAAPAEASQDRAADNLIPMPRMRSIGEITREIVERLEKEDASE